MRQVRNSVHLDFDRNGDLLLNLFGRPARPLRDDGYIVIGDIGISLNRKVVKSSHAADNKYDHNGQHDEPVVKREIDYLPNHSPVLENRYGLLRPRAAAI